MNVSVQSALCPIHGVSLPHAHYFQDMLQIHQVPEQDKVVTEDKRMNEYQMACMTCRVYRASMLCNNHAMNVGTHYKYFIICVRCEANIKSK